MEWLLLVAIGVTAFAATNIDDSLLLLLFFGDRRYRIRHVFAGQALGIGLLVLVSLAGTFLALAVPERWIGLLGLLPVALGARELVERRRVIAAEAPAAATAVTTTMTGDTPGWRQAAAVAGVTLANGGDNIGVYLPLFAARSAGQTALLLAVFAGMLAVWLFGTLYLARRSVLAGRIQRAGQILFPYALIGLGVAILAEAFLI
jgi:cadmium resistance protein CadD (predicted permease)